jgi:tRNA nucleotidyltransferase (CCA-adding enzyme)
MTRFLREVVERVTEHGRRLTRRRIYAAADQARYNRPVAADSDTPGTAFLAGVPAAVSDVISALKGRGHATYLVGGCVRDMLRGEPVGDFDVATAAPPGVVLEALPHSIPVGLRHGTVMVPTPDGPVDVTSFRAGPDIRSDLAHRDFTINAMAIDPTDGSLLDPFGGRSDLARRCLRAVGSAKERFGEDPLRMLRAARLAATLELEVDPEVAAAMTELRPRLSGVARERIRSEISLLLLAPGVARGLALLRRTGIEADLAPGAPPDAPVVVPAVPPALEIRLAAWLRGATTAGIFRRLRFSHRTSQRVAHLLQNHPIGAQVNARRDGEIRRLIARIGTDDLEPLFVLREAELSAANAAPDSPERLQLELVRTAVDRVLRTGALALRRFDLVLRGEDVMQLLGCGPGRRVGRALRHLTDQVIEDPAQNTPEHLRALLLRWAADHPPN